MKTVLLAMTEDQHDKRSWRCSYMVGIFILLTLVLNGSIREQAALIREAYNDSNDNILLLFISAVVAGQILTALILTTAETLRGDWPDKEAIMIIIFSHAGTIFLHDYLLSLGSAHSFLPVSFLQPVLVLTTIWIVTSLTARLHMWISMTLISLGCIFMSIRSSTVVNSDRSSLICILSGFAMVLRNIAIRQLVGVENVSVRFRGKKVIFALISIAALCLLILHVLASSIWLVLSLSAIITCAVSVSWLYVTTQVLKSYTVPFVSLFCLWANLLEAVVLTPRDHRPDIFVFIIALAIIVLGHYLFFKDHVDHTAGGNTSSLITIYPPKPVNTHEQYTRIEFLLFAALVISVIFFVFQPHVSGRDLNTLSYVGLDKVVRRLLMLEIKEENHVVEEEGKVQLP